MPDARPLRVLIAGANGLIGTEVTHQLEAHGHTVVRLVRREATADDEYSWDPRARTIDARVLETVDAVINLTGATTARIPWTPAYKRAILDSRIDTTRTLAEAITLAERKPSVFINASAVGYYGDRPQETLDESSPKGEGFLADVVEAWEQAALIASPVTRVVLARTGLVVARGGAFAPLSLTTKLGLGARVGTGRQHWPWISLHDEGAAIVHLLTSTLSGPVNLTGPEGATSEEATRALAQTLGRWHPFAIPTAVISIGAGEAGSALLLPDQDVAPHALLRDGFEFAHETVESAIDAVFA
jgi:uncharacterized protein (TIGR01777 family)